VGSGACRIYHYPKYRIQPFELMDKEGEVVDILETWKGKSISQNLSVFVKFIPKLKAHVKADKLEVL
jgi:hypothetical protein